MKILASFLTAIQHCQTNWVKECLHRNSVINYVTYRNNFDIQWTVSDWRSDCICFWCSTFSVDIYWAKQYTTRVMLAHSSIQSHWLIAVPACTSGLTTCTSLGMVFFKAAREKSNMLEIVSSAAGTKESSIPCVKWLWKDTSWLLSVTPVTWCVHRSV